MTATEILGTSSIATEGAAGREVAADTRYTQPALHHPWPVSASSSMNVSLAFRHRTRRLLRHPLDRILAYSCPTPWSAASELECPCECEF